MAEQPAAAATAARGGRGGGGSRGRGGRSGGRGAAASASAADVDSSSRPSPAAPAFSARGGRGGGQRLTSAAVSQLDGGAAAGGGYTAASGSVTAGAPLSTSLQRHPSTTSEMSVASSTSSPHPDCLLCCFPIASYTISTCQHSAQICGTCILRVQLFVNKQKKKTSDDAAAVADSAAASSSSSIVPAAGGADLLNEDNDFKPSAAAVAAAEAKKHRCPYCQSDWSVVLITREYDINSNDPRAMPPPPSSFGLATDTSKYQLSRWVYDSTLNVYFENEVTKSKYFMMSSLYCVLCFNLADAFSKNGNPAKRYDRVQLFLDKAALERHLEQSHQRYLCTACTTTRKIFIHEQQIFTKKELLHHFQFGSNDKTVTEYQPSGHVNAGVIEPHPFCQFCNTPFFTSDELYVHLTTDHRSCRFCQSEGFMKYFRTDAALRAHFARNHYLCDEGKCRKLDANHAAFRDVLAHRAHMLAAHSDSMSKEQIKKLQTIDLDMFRQPMVGVGGGGGISRLAGGHNSRHNLRPEDEYEFRPESPTRPAAASSSFNEYSESAEEFPSLGSGGGGFSGSSMSLEARSRYANEAARRSQASSSSSSSSSSMPRSQSQPINLHQSSGPSFLRNEEAFPSLGGVSSALPLAHAAGPGSATDAGFRVRGPPPPINEFPTLRSVVKQDAKQARKAEEKKSAAPKKQPSASPPPAAALSSVQDTRTISSVPLPMPSPVPASETGARNKALVGSVRTALRNDPDSFECFKTLSQRFRTKEIGCDKYLQRFNDLFARNPAGAADTERLLMELVALLPDESQRKELHTEYAKAKVMATIEKMKKESAAVASSASSSASASTPSYAAPKAKPVSSLAAAPSPSPAPSTSPAPAPAPTAAAAVSFARAASPGTFEVVQSGRDEKASKQAARRAAAAQGIGEFEGKAAKPLKRDDDEPAGFLDAIASKAEKAEREKKEKEEKEEQARKEEARLAAPAKKSWTTDGAPSLPGPSGRLPPGLNGPSSSPAMSKQNSWSALSGDADDEPSQISEPVGAAGPSGRGKAQRAAASYRAPSPPSPSSSPMFDPPLPSSSASTSAAAVMPEPEELERHVERLSSLRVAPSAKASLELLALLFQNLSSLIAARHGAVNAPTNRRHQMSEQSRASLMAMMRQTRWSHALEFSRAARLGLMPNSVQLLSSVAGMYARFGSDQTLVNDMMSQSLAGMGSSELFLLLEYTHQLLLQLTKPSHPDLKQLESAFAADEERRQRQNEQFKGRSIKQTETAREDIFDRSSAAASSASATDDSSSGGKKQKKQKQLLFKLG